jgi:hypothetical protein
MLPQSGGRAVKDLPGSLWRRHDVDVVQKREHGFALCQGCPQLLQSWMQCQRVQGWHERVSLFAAFRLVNRVDVTVIVAPQVL